MFEDGVRAALRYVIPAQAGIHPNPDAGTPARGLLMALR